MDTKLLEYIIEYKKLNDGVPPTRRQMADFLQLGLPATQNRLNELIEVGLVVRGDGARNLQVVGGQWLPPV